MPSHIVVVTIYFPTELSWFFMLANVTLFSFHATLRDKIRSVSATVTDTAVSFNISSPVVGSIYFVLFTPNPVLSHPMISSFSAMVSMILFATHAEKVFVTIVLTGSEKLKAVLVCVTAK